jgi:peptidoglycan/LPS O-acetylase OafA/YrhL
VTLGEASYVLYLFHPMVAPAVPMVLNKLGMQIGWLSVLLSVVVAVVASKLIYHLADEPIAHRLRSILSHKRQPALGS